MRRPQLDRTAAVDGFNEPPPHPMRPAATGDLDPLSTTLLAISSQADGLPTSPRGAKGLYASGAKGLYTSSAPTPEERAREEAAVQARA